jgi:hypothetical protein
MQHPEGPRRDDEMPSNSIQCVARHAHFNASTRLTRGGCVSVAGMPLGLYVYVHACCYASSHMTSVKAHASRELSTLVTQSLMRVAWTTRVAVWSPCASALGGCGAKAARVRRDGFSCVWICMVYRPRSAWHRVYIYIQASEVLDAGGFADSDPACGWLIRCMPCSPSPPRCPKWTLSLPRRPRMPLCLDTT